jgi:hypothetical protein
LTGEKNKRASRWKPHEFGGLFANQRGILFHVGAPQTKHNRKSGITEREILRGAIACSI